MSDPIQAAEDVLADFSYYKALSGSTKLFDALTALLTHARTLEAELARKSAVADAYWEIVESYRAENAEMREAWAKVRAEIEAEVGGPDLSRSDGLRKALAILAQHAGAANRLDKGGAD